MVKEFNQFDIVLIDFGQGQGSELQGKRPAIIVQNGIGNKYASTTIVIPLSSRLKNPNQPTHYLLKSNGSNHLDKDSMAQAECIRQVSETRIIKKIGSVTSQKDIAGIKAANQANFI